MGILILLMLINSICFHKKKITGIAFIAVFNKDLSGGRYGPIVAGGHIFCALKVTMLIILL